MPNKGCFVPFNIIIIITTIITIIPYDYDLFVCDSSPLLILRCRHAMEKQNTRPDFRDRVLDRVLVSWDQEPCSKPI